MITSSSLALIVFGYLLGSISSAIIVCKLLRLPDPRTFGSNNPGATNVLRHGSKVAAGITLVGDMLKGVIPVVIAHAVGADNLTLALVASAAFLGHLYPVFFRFQGGKGVATMLGALLALQFWAGLATCGVWLFMAFVVKISSLSALVATATAPLWIWLLTRSPEITIAVAAMTVLLYWRHRSNIQNLLKGTEDKIQGPDQDPEDAGDAGGSS